MSKELIKGEKHEYEEENAASEGLGNDRECHK